MTIAPLISSCYNFGGTMDKTLYVNLPVSQCNVLFMDAFDA